VEVVVRDGYLRRIVYAVHVGYAVKDYSSDDSLILIDLLFLL